MSSHESFGLQAVMLYQYTITMTIEVVTSTTLCGDELCVVINLDTLIGKCICAVRGRDLIGR